MFYIYQIAILYNEVIQRIVKFKLCKMKLYLYLPYPIGMPGLVGFVHLDLAGGYQP